MSLKIEAGKYYRTRDGRKVGPFVNRKWTDGFPWDESTEDAFFWSDDGKCQVEENGRNDLVSEWTGTPTGPVREVTRKEIVPGVYGRVKVTNIGHDGPIKPNWVRWSIYGGDDWDAAELRAAASVLIDLASALESQP